MLRRKREANCIREKVDRTKILSKNRKNTHTSAHTHTHACTHLCSLRSVATEFKYRERQRRQTTTDDDDKGKNTRVRNTRESTNTYMSRRIRNQSHICFISRLLLSLLFVGFLVSNFHREKSYLFSSVFRSQAIRYFSEIHTHNTQ